MKSKLFSKAVAVFLTVLMLFSVLSVTLTVSAIECKAHTYDEGTVTVKPGCLTSGKKLYTCTKCGHSKTEILVPDGHIFDRTYLKTETVEGTCLEAGNIHYELTCPACEEIIFTFNEPLFADHKWETIDYYAGNCKVAGYREDQCIFCGTTQKIYFGGEHDGIKTTGQSAIPTCTTGYFSTGGCYTCGSAVTIQYPPLGHLLENITVIKEPTCTEPGINSAVCTRPGCDINGEYEVPALGHDIRYGRDITPDCCVQGISAGAACLRCEAVFVEDVYYPYFEHDFKPEIIQAADAKNNGKTVFTCQNVTETSWVHIFETEYTVSEVIPNASEDGSFVIDTDSTGVVGNIYDITGLYEGDVEFSLEETDGITLDSDGNITVSGNASATVLVSTPFSAAKITLEVRVFDSLEIIADDSIETGTVLEFEVIKKPFNEKVTDAEWYTSDESIVFVSDGRLIAVGTGTVTITAVSGNLTASKEITLVASSSAKKITFNAMDKMHYIIEDYFAVFNSGSLYWSDSDPIRFRVHLYSTFPFETCIVYINGVTAEADKDGYYNVAAQDKDIIITVTGAVYDDSGDENGEKISIWQAIINFFKKIIEFFKNFGK